MTPGNGRTTFRSLELHCAMRTRATSRFVETRISPALRSWARLMARTRSETFVVPEYDFTAISGECRAGGFVPSGAAKRTCFTVTRYTELLSTRKQPEPIPLGWTI